MFPSQATAAGPSTKPMTELVQAFDELTRSRPNLIANFAQTFEERAKKTGLDESKGLHDGLIAVLAGLLGQYPGLLSDFTSPENETVREPFKEAFRAALVEVVKQHPSTILLFERHLKRDSRPRPDFLGALLQVYARNEVSHRPSVRPIQQPGAGRERHRCRLYKIDEEVLPGEDLFVEVWDTEQTPYEHSRDSLPSGELVGTRIGTSLEEVRSEMDAFELERAIFLANDWESRGSI